MVGRGFDAGVGGDGGGAWPPVVELFAVAVKEYRPFGRVGREPRGAVGESGVDGGVGERVLAGGFSVDAAFAVADDGPAPACGANDVARVERGGFGDPRLGEQQYQCEGGVGCGLTSSGGARTLLALRRLQGAVPSGGCVRGR